MRDRNQPLFTRPSKGTFPRYVASTRLRAFCAHGDGKRHQNPLMDQGG